MLKVVNISNTPGRSEYPVITADSRGYFYVAWEDRTSDGIRAIYLTERAPCGDWTQPKYIILEPQTPLGEPDITVDKENTLHVVGQYTNPGGWGEILYTKKPLNGNWTTPEIIGMYGRAAAPKIAVDDYDNVHVVWQELVGNWPIFYIKKTKDGLWSMPVEISKEESDWHSDLSIGVSPDGYTHVVWIGWKENSDPINMVVYTTNVLGDTWSYPQEVAIDRLLGINVPSIAVDNEGVVYVVWGQDRDIFYTFKPISTEQWEKPARVCSTATLSMQPHLALDSDGSLHLLWEEESQIGYASKPKEGDWTESKFYSLTVDISFCVIKPAVGSNNIGFVFYGYIPTDNVGKENYEIFFGEISKK